MRPTVPVSITKVDATIPDGIDLLWNGWTVNSGPLQIHLDDNARGQDDNRGELDYEHNLARARFNVVIELIGIPKLLARAAYCELMPPVRAVVHTEGVITEDHNFGLSGPMEFLPHPLFGAAGASASVLPGR